MLILRAMLIQIMLFLSVRTCDFCSFQVGYRLQYISEHWLTEPVWSGVPSNVEAVEHVDSMMLIHLGTAKQDSCKEDI